MTELPECLTDSKCIIHIDLDCFYSQVEEVRLGLDPSKPVAVQQWANLIAVNYAARAYGVTRLCSVEEAKRLCPDITLVHVATYAPNETQAQYHPNPSIATHKTALDVYHTAGKQIFKIFKQHCPLVQKLGSDEAFLDITAEVNTRLCESFIPTHPALLSDKGLPVARVDDFVLDWTTLSHVVPSVEEKEQRAGLTDDSNSGDAVENPNYCDPTTWFDIQLFVASQLAADIRKHVYDELHYTCSAGIAHNKVLAKLGSSRNKPNKQTVIRHHIASQFMKDIPFNKIRNLGGKFGQRVETRYKIQTAGDMWQYPLEELQTHFGESSGLWLYNIVRGIDSEEGKYIKATSWHCLIDTRYSDPLVILIKAPKTLTASKNIRPPLQTDKELAPWYAVLSGELQARIMRNWKEHQTWPKTLFISYRNSNYATNRSRSSPMLHQSDLLTPDKLQHKVTAMFADVLPDMFPCTVLAIYATGLTPDASVTNHTINRFFNSAGPSTTEPKKSPMEDLSPPSTTWTCDRCQKPIPIEKVDEHTDYHYALDLDTPRQAPPPKKRPKRSFFDPYSPT